MRKSRRALAKQLSGTPGAWPARFVQLIEFQTTRIDEVRVLERRWRDAIESAGASSAMSITKDRDRHNRYVWMIEFPSHDNAAQCDALEETGYIVEQLMKLADGPAVFRNLDVLDRLP
jgi:hypothetical protein